MIKHILLIASLGFSSVVFSQQTLIDKVTFDSKTVLVGMANDYNTDKTYDQYNFFLDDASKIENIKLNLEYGYELNEKVTDSNHFMIYAIKDRKIIDQWLVNPKLYNVFHNGIAYSFDADKLQAIAEKHPLKFEVENKQYKNQKEFIKAKKELEKDTSIFLMYEPEFNYEGSFEISLKRTDEISDAQKAEEYLRNIASKITKKKVLISYALSEKNIMDPSQFTMIVAGDESIYSKFKVDDATISEWKPEINEAIIVKKK